MTSILMLIFRIGFIFLLLVSARISFAADKPLLIAAASSIRPALDRIRVAFVNEYETEVTISYGASGNLTRQITRGAPYDLFLSADREFPMRLIDSGLGLESSVYAIGEAVFLRSVKSNCPKFLLREDLLKYFDNKTAARFAIANPVTAPYGRLSKQILTNAGLWDSLQGHLVFGASVAQATHYIRSGAADCGLISRSLALLIGDDDVEIVSTDNINAKTVLEHMVVRLSDTALAREFYMFMLEEKAQIILRQTGFRVE